MSSRPRIVILGAGPAGAAVAIGLKRLGETPLVIGEPRRFAAVEGVSARVVEGLRSAGFERALAVLAPDSPRCVLWNGVLSQANTERLIDRQRFDVALLEDLERHGIEVWRGRVVEQAADGAGHRLEVVCDGAHRRVEADFLVEARGRAAPAGGRARLRGAETVSILQYWHGSPGQAQSAVQSCADGWAWMGRLDDGRRYLQLTLDSASARLPPKRSLGAFCQARFAAMEIAPPFIHDAQVVGAPHARASTPVLGDVVADDTLVRVGDAAMAVDPLSGNGIFQALSSALQAPAVIATLLYDPARAALAKQFHQQRVEGLFHRFARIGRDFYAQESRWAEAPFWSARRAWPDAQPAHAEVAPECVSIRRMPVVDGGRIVAQDVVVTPDQPLGIWRMDGIEIAPLLRAVRACAAPADVEDAVAARLGGDIALARRIVGWMRVRHWID